MCISIFTKMHFVIVIVDKIYYSFKNKKIEEQSGKVRLIILRCTETIKLARI
jgi:hypothetical protein